jgi:NADPH:quinone reductase-like Zn-dependent oxidoreductase
MSKFEAFIVRRDTTGEIVTAVEPLALDDLPAGEVVIAVDYSSLNYKDALACRGHAGVVGKLPHVPGIDCAGRVAESSDPRYAVGQPVLVTGYKLGRLLAVRPRAGRVGGPDAAGTRSSQRDDLRHGRVHGRSVCECNR